MFHKKSTPSNCCLAGELQMLDSASRRLSKSHVQLANSVWTTNTALGMKQDRSSTKILCTGNETWWNYKRCALGMKHDGTTNTVHWEWNMTELQTLCTGNEPWLNYKHCALGMNHHQLTPPPSPWPLSPTILVTDQADKLHRDKVTTPKS